LSIRNRFHENPWSGSRVVPRERTGRRQTDRQTLRR